MILNYAYSYVIRYLGTLHADNRYTDKQWLLHHRHIMDSCREHWGAGYKAAAPVGPMQTHRTSGENTAESDDTTKTRRVAANAAKSLKPGISTVHFVRDKRRVQNWLQLQTGSL